MHEFIDKCGYGAARLRELRVFVETLAAAREMLDERVDENVGGAGVERKDLRWFARSGQDGDVGDAAEVKRDAAEFWMAVQQIVGVRDERRALPAERDVGGAEVGDRGDAGARCDDTAVADLQRGGGRAAEILDRRTLMKDRLAVIAEDRDFFGRDAEVFAGRQGGFGVDFAKAEIQSGSGRPREPVFVRRRGGFLFALAEGNRHSCDRAISRLGSAERQKFSSARHRCRRRRCRTSVRGRGAVCGWSARVQEDFTTEAAESTEEKETDGQRR